MAAYNDPERLQYGSKSEQVGRAVGQISRDTVGIAKAITNDFGAYLGKRAHREVKNATDLYRGIKSGFMSGFRQTNPAPAGPPPVNIEAAAATGAPPKNAYATPAPEKSFAQTPPTVTGDNDAEYRIPGGFEDVVTDPGASTIRNVGAFGGDKDIYRNDAPPPGFGQVVFSDSYGGATGAVNQGGGFAKAGPGPFGRSEEAQTRLQNRLAQYASAIETMRSMRGGGGSGRGRLERQASGSVSTNQGLGAFLSQASDRNYARKRLTELEAQDLKRDDLANDRAKMQQDATQQGFENALALQNLDKGRYDTDLATVIGPDGLERKIPYTTDTRTGQGAYAEQVAQPMSVPEMNSVVTALADAKKEKDGGFLTSEKETYDGMSREEWIKSKVDQMTSLQSETGDFTRAKMAKQAGALGMTVDQYKAKMLEAMRNGDI